MKIALLSRHRLFRAPPSTSSLWSPLDLMMSMAAILLCPLHGEGSSLPPRSRGGFASAPKQQALHELNRGVVSDDGIFRFEVPGDWTPLSRLNQRASIQVGHLQTGEFMIAFSTARSALSPESAFRKAAAELKIPPSATRAARTVNFSVARNPARLETLRTQFNTKPVLYYLATIQTSTHLVQVIFWTSPAKQRELDRRILRILHSFRELRR